MGQSRKRFKPVAALENVLKPTISVILPAFRATPYIAEGVRSVFAQTRPDWLLYVVSDDGVDYEAVLGEAGLSDSRLRFLSSGAIGGGASRARNLALEVIDTPYATILDADDRLKPRKLERVAEALQVFPIVTTALEVMDDGYRTLRRVGDGPDRPLGPADHKFVSLSMDSMVAWDRRRCDARYDLELTNMTDLEFLMQLYRTATQSFHLGTPLHDYVKVSTSMSNGPGFSEKMIRSKQTLLARLAEGRYEMADPAGPAGIARFLELSLEAEESYPAALEERPGLLFEDHLEPLLRSATP